MNVRKDLLLRMGAWGFAAGTSGFGFLFRNEINDLVSDEKALDEGNVGGIIPVPETDEFGIPNRCKDPSASCELSADDLKKIKFEELNEESEEATVSEYDDEQKITLVIKNRDYIFKNSGNKDIEIQKGSKTVTIKGSGKTRFTANDQNKTLEKVELGEYGIPERCKDECQLTQADLEDIKFQALGEDDKEVTVEGYVDPVTLKIITEGNNKRYIFNNSGDSIEIKKGEDNTVTLGSGKTKFTTEDKALKELKLNSLGAPKECESGVCSLEEDDLKDIKFKALESGSGEATVTNFESKKISLEIIGDDRYIFTNSSKNNVEIKKTDSSTVTLKEGKTKFRVVGGYLELLELNSLGAPKECETEVCTLEEDDLKDIAFKDLGDEAGEITVSNFPDEKITLKVDGSVKNKERYIFSNGSDNAVEIKKANTTKVFLKKKGKTKFTVEAGKLKEQMLDDLGLPQDCTSECKLTADDLEDIKFEGLGDENEGSVTVSGTNLSGQIITLKIEGSEADGNKKYVFKNNTSGGDITIRRGTEGNRAVTLGAKGESKFSKVGGKLKTLELSELGLPSNCSEKTDCNLTESDLKSIKFTTLDGSGESTDLPQNKKITLKIEKIPETGSNKYIFSNDEKQDVKVTKGDKEVALKAEGKTRFFVEDNKLKEVELGSFGLPKRCEVLNEDCKLTADDLEQIKFKDLEEGKGGVEVSGLSSEKTITMRIETGYGNKKKYIFSNDEGQDVKIKKGDKEITLKKGEKTKFSEGGDQLTKLQLGNFGLPEGCNDQCTLTSDDLEEVKFSALGNEGKVTVSPTPSQSISLKIENGDANKKKYIFRNSGKKEINIQRGSSGSNKVTLKVGKTRFEEEVGSKLKAFATSDYGLPASCISNKSCTLTEDDLELIKFDGFEEGKDTVVSGFRDGKVTLKIVTDGSNNNRYIFKNDSDNEIKIKNGNEEVILNKSGETNFEAKENCQLKEMELGSFGLPSYCLKGEGVCSLIEGDMQRIKFQALTKGPEKITISSFPTESNKVTLKIDSTDSNNKKYIFKNDYSSDVKISKGKDSVTLKARGKTKFTGDKDELKTFELDDKTKLPKTCITSNKCSLTKDDMEDINFKELDGGKGNVTVNSYPEGKTINLQVVKDASNSNRYVFTNNSNSEIKVTKGAKSVTLNKQVKTRFKDEGGKLSKLTTDTYGLPTNCKTKCELVQDDLEQVKFEGFKDNKESTVTGLSSGQKISLNVVNDGSNKKRYIFFNNADGEVKIKRESAADVSLKSKVKTRFTGEGKNLKKLVLGSYGLPKECKNSCSLVLDDLEQVKFEGFTDKDSTVTGLSSGSITLKIENIPGDDNAKKYIFDNSTKTNINIQNGSHTVTLEANKKTKFTVNKDGKLKKMEMESNGIPKTCTKDCSLKAENIGDINFPGFEGEGKVTVNFNNPIITLRIENHYENGMKKYIFTVEGEKDLEITKGGKKVILKAKKEKNRFKGEGDKLVDWKLGYFGLPEGCGSQCTLSEDDLEQIRFKDLGGGNEKVTVDDLPEGKTITLKVEEGNYKFTNITGRIIKIKKGVREISWNDYAVIYYSNGGGNQLQTGGVS